MKTIVPQEGKPITCSKCEEVITREDVRTDRMRLYDRNGRYLCELCCEEAIENERGDDDSI